MQHKIITTYTNEISHIHKVSFDGKPFSLFYKSSIDLVRGLLKLGIDLKDYNYVTYNANNKEFSCYGNWSKKCS